MKFVLADTNRFHLKGTKKRFIHLATVHRALQEYMCFVDVWTGKTYIEKITGGQLEFIGDDSLARGLHDFLVDKGVLDIGKPTLPDVDWLRAGKAR